MPNHSSKRTREKAARRLTPALDLHRGTSVRLMIIAALAAALLTGCASTPTKSPIVPAANTRDGSSMARAIVIEAQGDREGTAAEFEWVSVHFPGSKPSGQGLLNDGERYYDAIDFVTASGEQKRAYFDITGYLGKR